MAEMIRDKYTEYIVFNSFDCMCFEYAYTCRNCQIPANKNSFVRLSVMHVRPVSRRIPPPPPRLNVTVHMFVSSAFGIETSRVRMPSNALPKLYPRPLNTAVRAATGGQLVRKLTVKKSVCTSHNYQNVFDFKSLIIF